MVEKVGSRQKQILRLLLEHKVGLSIDEIAAELAISRNAVQQHFAVLERDGYIKKAGLNKTAGRPVRSYALTDKGINSFPKQYAWFAELILNDLKNDMGSEAFQAYLHKLGNTLSQKLMAQFIGKDLPDRLNELLGIMTQLGFQVQLVDSIENGGGVIEACNCIYHDLAHEHKEICEFDRSLMAALLEKDISQLECMADGGKVCRFKIPGKLKNDDAI